MDVYIIALDPYKNGDIEHKVVDKETFDWVVSTNNGKPVGCTDDEWIDTLIPESQAKQIADASNFATNGKFKYIVKHNNEMDIDDISESRAVDCMELERYQECWSMDEVDAEVTKYGDTIVETRI
jgi:hypothetical protein